MDTCTADHIIWFQILIQALFHHRSEGPAQVFLLVLVWLVTAFGHLGRKDWKKIVLSYDNMCHLNNLKVAKKPLALPGKLQHIWLDVHKVIDDLHLRNHTDTRCQKYSAAPLREANPHLNTMSCEQTFVWLSRFKKTLCAMPKVHFHFYLHWMVKRRNKYVSYCYTHVTHTTYVMWGRKAVIRNKIHVYTYYKHCKYTRVFSNEWQYSLSVVVCHSREVSEEVRRSPRKLE